MGIACPHCSAPYFSRREVFTNAARIDTASAPLRCARCKGLSCVAPNGPNAVWAIALLALGIVASYPSAISDSYLGRFGDTVRFIRADIWAVAVMAAYLAFAFSARLRKLEGVGGRTSRRWASLAVLVFLSVILLYGCFLIWG
jgi:hypothetical protein